MFDLIEREDRHAKLEAAELLTPEGDTPAPPALFGDAFGPAADFAARRV